MRGSKTRWRALLGAVTCAILTLPPRVSGAQRPAARAILEHYERDVAAFSADLAHAGHTDPLRARVIAAVAVREAYRRALPPALLFGVMMQENRTFLPTARSTAGAIGLMQIMPQWVRDLRGRLGQQLENPVTNIKHGAYVLAFFARQERGDWHRTLQRYSGGARRYSRKVMEHIDRHGQSLCPRGPDWCVGVPLYMTYRRGAPKTALSLP